MISSIDEIIAEAKAGRMFILVDDPNRENEGDLVIPAQFADSHTINFMTKYGRGLVCLTINQEQAHKLKLNMMSNNNQSMFKTAFTTSIEAASGITTGISAHDRAHTIKTAINSHATDKDIVSPGHVFPIIAQNGGVLVRAGHTEASVDIARLAGLSPSGVICEIMHDDGTMARMPELIQFAKTHNLKIGTIADLIAYRRKYEKLVLPICESTLSTQYGEFKAVVYQNLIDQIEHVALIKGNISSEQPVLVRMHSIDILSDLIKDTSYHKQHILDQSFEIISKEGGVIVLIRDLRTDLISHNLINRDKNQDSNIHQIKNYGIGAQILIDLGIKNMTLISNNQKIVTALEGFDINLVGYRKLNVSSSTPNFNKIKTTLTVINSHKK
ncbi:3,4-dihydroxy-2-butanone-4-phosphate synthase [Rickettsiales endosymbiont of Stachyamoeba lipophora]|uniref:3,4-dihydroxy-2-butanone-4-phosphate synthase n=1 Tax=Rickettsiales endosymbiont of Stachyamoeba lipophora TaxID=2486578 RepID=UPI000F64EDCC|nr:3,4-dihydroxy-2-butanone-4-phosphate synthase [Rickettsiales endosymbiont of Stachyamoeba lipophora]